MNAPDVIKPLMRPFLPATDLAPRRSVSVGPETRYSWSPDRCSAFPRSLLAGPLLGAPQTHVRHGPRSAMCHYWKSAVLGDVVRNVKCHINNARTMLGLQTEAALLKHLQHRDIFWQDFRNQFLDSAGAG